MTSTNYPDDQALLPNTPAQPKSLLHSQEQAAGSISPYVNTKFMCFKQEGDISTLSIKPLKLLDQFTYLGSNISSTERDINICFTKVRTGIDWLSII